MSPIKNSLSIFIVGGGYVGIGTGITLAHIGWHVNIIENDPVKCSYFEQYKLPIHEAGSDEMLRASREKIVFLSEIPKQFPPDSLIFIAVGTPTDQDGSANLQDLFDAVAKITEALPPEGNSFLIIKSTVPVGTNKKIRDQIQNFLSTRQLTTKISVISCPEFLRQGNALLDSLYPSRLVFGVNDEPSRAIMSRIFRPIIEQTFETVPYLNVPSSAQTPEVYFTSPENAELIKYGSNAFLAVKISFINELAMLSEKVGCDIVEVSHGIGLDPRIGKDFLNPGLGWGGSCFPKDTLALMSTANACGIPLQIIQASRNINNDLIVWYGTKIIQAAELSGAIFVTCLGLAFKPGTDDIRDSQSIKVIEFLLKSSKLMLRLTDPQALDNFRRYIQSAWTAEDQSRIQLVQKCEDAVRGAKITVLLTEWKTYTDIHLYTNNESAERMVVIDTRNCLTISEADLTKFKYVGLGRKGASAL